MKKKVTMMTKTTVLNAYSETVIMLDLLYIFPHYEQ